MSLFSRLESCRLPDESNSKLCNRAGITYRQYLDMKTRGAEPRQETLRRMASNLGIALLWLEQGQGPRDPEEFEKMVRGWHERCQA